MEDWTKQLKEWGQHRQWRPLPRRGALREFCNANGFGERGVAADRAFRLGYAALARATAEERSACQDWQAVLELQQRQVKNEADRLKAIAEKRQRSLAAMAENPGWKLLAGEKTEILATGTRREVEANLWRVTKCAREPSTGRGCWMILAPDGTEATRGGFDGEIYW